MQRAQFPQLVRCVHRQNRPHKERNQRRDRQRFHPDGHRLMHRPAHVEFMALKRKDEHGTQRAANQSRQAAYVSQAVYGGRANSFCEWHQ